MALINVDSWQMEYDAVEKLGREIQSQLALRNQENFYSISANLRIKIKQFSSELNQLQRNLKDLGRSRAITKDEEERRLRNLEQLQSKLILIEQQFKEQPESKERKELFTKTPRNLWEGEEDQDEPLLDNSVPIDNLRHEQTQILAQQDDQLDNLAKVISRQKQIAIRIGDEVETHNEILDDLGVAMENTDTRITSETRHVDRVARRDKTCGYWIIIISLFVAIVVIGIL